MSRSIYLTRPNWQGEIDNSHEAVVEVLRHGPRYIKVAQELWKLAGRDDRVKEIRALLEIAYERELPTLYTEEVKTLDSLMNGLDQALKTSLQLDDNWQIPPERMEEVRSRVQLLRLSDVGGRIGSDGVMEGISEVYELRGFLEQAIERGLNLTLG